MMHDHLDMTLTEAVARLNKDYTTDIKIFDKIQAEALKMADNMSDGIISQFPNQF